jgi:2-phospho-L-lactate guanylyltransferase
MTGWRAIVPLKSAGTRKTRLGMTSAQRHEITEHMVGHVLGALGEVTSITDIGVLSTERRAGTIWLTDKGRGLNAELQDARRRWLRYPVLIIHADLPDLTPRDIRQLIDAASEDVVAIAPDRHDTGTNALAIPGGVDLPLAFGPGSFQAHLVTAPGARIIRTPGLSYDLDTPDDLAIRSSWKRFFPER